MTTPNPYAHRTAKHFDGIRYDEALIQKYNRQGPRYTSYPTALEFAPIESGVEASILAKRDPSVPLSLYIHIPFCHHLCYYCGCNKIITKKNSDAGDYLTYIFAEIRHKKSLLRGQSVVKQLHLGGGTPTFLSDDELSALWQFLQEEFIFADDGDFSIEIDPRELRPTTLKLLRDLGFNRLSFGVQDLDQKVQIAVNRVQPLELIQSVMQEAQALGFVSTNIDLIYGLPHQTPKSMDLTIQEIIKLSPDRLSVFNYAHLPDRFLAQKRIREADLPSPADKLAMFGNIITALGQAGYQYIGIDHFAKPDDAMAMAQRRGELHRNFQGYAILGECDLLGFGVSAISQIGEHILQNPTALAHYQDAIKSGALPSVKHIQSDAKDALRRHVIMNLLCHDYMSFQDLHQKFGIDPKEYFANEIMSLQDMAKDGLVQIDDDGITILPKGRILGRSIAMVFDEYLGKKHANRFSKVI
ncbi:oxygen-independent coproporphyrinogen III oxidase [Moraxella catarrhalis]|uniref:Coproporphyrinogen-III oxidase n=1 Tax=Moraxella catarrhalis TaxID=480 RepID=A0A198URW0_MORCA|nr:oxygen-independent coproporphyrinogen III oxidase [Moraxella catarrhalis]OAU95945.1 Coproporphyrinogen III oxidase, oxygen-independent [Moraxella catarrhalis]OAU98017.1 Coproporphyrinogen III oxidase, oxygen-independent [Moraxella catarrhalis]OAU98893.1 Coproporphyrinogen III oxidase, oxygen-independent [Moraxella catarrhalis]